MKYFGEKSLSSFFSNLCNIGRYLFFPLSIIALLLCTFIIFFSVYEDAWQAAGFIPDSVSMSEDKPDEDWEAFKKIPLAFKLFFYPYLSFLLVLAWKILDRSRHLFRNFKENLIFKKDNVNLIRQIGKLLLIFSVFTFDLSGVLLSAFVLMLCEIFKNGTALQEEHDLTV